MSFLPKNYEQPSGKSNYMKLEDGDNKFRVLGSAIVGWEWWTEDKEGKRKPNRVKSQNDISDSDLDEINHQEAATNRTQLKHFWAFPVLDRKDKNIKILEITQSSIQSAINKHVKNEDWGDPKDYDFTITREGEKLNTKYSVIASPKTKLDEGVAQAYKDMNINLDALYNSDDPFAANIDLDEIDDNDCSR